MAKKYIRIWQALNIIERIQKKEKKHYGITPVFLALNTAKDYIKNLPAADVQEVKHGKWKYKQGYKGCYCSKCGGFHLAAYDFCHWCGAKMDA